jgi:hypothetical protein
MGSEIERERELTTHALFSSSLFLLLRVGASPSLCNPFPRQSVESQDACVCVCVCVCF